MAQVVRFLLPRPVRGTRSLQVMLWFQIIQAAATMLATGFMAKLVDNKPWGYFGLPLRCAFRSEFWVGAIAGFGALAVQLELMHLCGWFDFGPTVLHGGEIFKFGAFWGLFFLLTGFFEEGFLRGYPQRVLTNGMGFWPAALLLSIVFACLHLGNSGENKFGIFMVFVDGMLMCFTVWRTGTVWFAVGNHAAWDWAQTFFFGTPDSGMKPIGALFSPSFHGPTLLAGGNAGPEGSVLVLLSEALIAVVVAVLYRDRRYSLTGDEQPAVEKVVITPAS
jgi:membrane protease YdiL (CAAX protease family)